MRSVMMGIGLAASLTLGLPAMATPTTGSDDTADTGTTGSDDGTTGSDDGTTGSDDGSTDDGSTTSGDDTEAYVEGDGAADLAGDKGGCDSVLGSSSAGFLLILGAGALRRRR